MVNNNINEFTALFRQTCHRISYLNDLDTILHFPPFSSPETLDHCPPVSDYYLNGRFTKSTNNDADELPIIRLANRACEIEDNTNSIVWAQLRQYPGLNFGLGKKGKTNSPLGGLDPTKPEFSIIHRAMIFDLVSMLSYGKPIISLWEEAASGDLEAFFDLIRIDKSALTTTDFAQLLRDRQYNVDWDFFKKLGQAISKHPISDRDYQPKAIILTARFWREEFHQWSHQDLIEFLVQNDVLPKTTSGHRYFLRSLNRVGLNKKRGRPKKRQ